MLLQCYIRLFFPHALRAKDLLHPEIRIVRFNEELEMLWAYNVTQYTIAGNFQLPPKNKAITTALDSILSYGTIYTYILQAES